MNRSLGQWNAYVEGGPSREERNQRLLEVPEALRPQVKAHVEGAFSLKRYEKDRRRRER